MAKAERKSRPVPHLAELYAATQVLYPSVGDAEAAVAAVFAAADARDRFALLAALTSYAGLELPVVEQSEGAEGEASALTGTAAQPATPEAATPQSPALEAGTPETAAPQSAAPEVATPQSAAPEVAAPTLSESEPADPEAKTPDALMQQRILARARERRVLAAFASLSPLGQFVAFLAAHGIRNAGDLARIFHTDAPRARARYRSVSLALTGAIDDALGATSSEGDPADFDRLGGALEGLALPPGSELKQAVLGSLPVKPSRRTAPRPSRLIPVAVVLLLAVALGLGLPRLFQQNPVVPTAEPAANAMGAAAAVLPDARTLYETSDPEDADSWFKNRVDWAFEVPHAAGSPLRGTGFVDLAPGVQAPALFFGPSPGPPELSVAVVNYALLQGASDRLVLDRDVLDALANGESVGNQVYGNLATSVIRFRDDLYLIVADAAGAGSLSDRLQFSD